MKKSKQNHGQLSIGLPKVGISLDNPLKSKTVKVNKHPQLDSIRLLWGLPDETLNKVLWANTHKGQEEQAVGLASNYLDYMDSIASTTYPESAWEQWCRDNHIEHEIPNNPYL